MAKNLKVILSQLTICILFTFFLTLTCKADNSSLYAIEVLKLVENNYQALDSYYDKGKSIENNAITEFETYFKKRANLYLFKWTESYLNKEIFNSQITMNKMGVFRYRGSVISKEHSIEKYDNFEDAIIRSYPTAKGLLGVTTPLMFENMDIRKITSYKHVRFMGNELLDGEKCIYLVLEQVNARNDQIFMHLWIVENQKLIKKVKRINGDMERIYYFEKLKPNIEIQDKIFQKIQPD